MIQGNDPGDENDGDPFRLPINAFTRWLEERFPIDPNMPWLSDQQEV